MIEIKQWHRTWMLLLLGFNLHFPIDVDDQRNPGRRVVHKLYVYNCRPGLGCSLNSIGE